MSELLTSQLSSAWQTTCTMAHPGLLSWANSVRLTMAGDPGRQAFKDQIQAVGYLFLDDYLDNIVSGAKQGPLIELVKTPGRKKAVSNKPKPGPSKLSSTVLFENNQDGENVPPVNNFHKTLLSVKADQVHKPQTEKPQRTALLPIQPANNEPPATSLSTTSAPSLAIPQSSLSPPLSPPEHNQLSVIAEDEEPSERAHLSNSVHDIKVMGLPISLPECPAPPRPANFENSMGNTSHETQEQSSAVSDVDTFHSISLTSFDAKLKDETISQIVDTEQMVVDVDPDPTAEEGQHVDDHMTSSSQKLSEKSLHPTFPTLPDPVPLRKSIRIRDPSMNLNMLGAATPGAATAKRTSWLSKAREAKALEGTVKKINTPFIPPMPPLNMALVSAASLPQGKKRKSGEMLDSTRPTEQEGEPIQKIAKLSEAEIAPRRSKENTSIQVALKQETVVQRDELSDANTSEEGVLNMLKKTVEGLGARTNKTMGKSLGGNAASILAEAKAAAEARLAARDRKKEESTPVMNDTAAPAKLIVSKDKDVDMAPSTSATPHGGRLSVSDLFPREGRVKEKHRSPEKVFQKAIPPLKEANSNQQRTSTTPPLPPPAQSATLVFTKPVPVFVPPVPALSKPASSTIQEALFRPPSAKYLVPSSIVSGFGSHLESSPKRKTPITAQSTLESLQSETIFDNEDGPAWMPSTQDTEFTTVYGSQSQQDQICDEDDSWPIDEKLAAGVQWTYGSSKEDSMTWSTLPSQSQRGGDTGPVTTASLVKENEDAVGRHNPTNSDVEMENEKDLISRDTELEEIVLGCKSTVSLVQQLDSTQNQSQFPLASSGSSQSQVGFFGQASKFLSNALGTGKRKPEVKKVLQMAAVAAKKQQEEAGKKATRLKEMEIRRQQAIQRKAEEEKAKTMEEERKMKEGAERRKKDREEQTEKRPFKPTANKREDDPKKRKIDPSPVEKKNEVKKPAPSILLGKSHLKYATKLPAESSTSYSNLMQANASSAMTTVDSVKAIPIASSSSQQTKSIVPQKQVMDDDFTQPSQLVQSQMAARAKAQIEASKPVVPSESIELPDINSEYSDSEDENRKRTYDPPHWAQSPELRHALEQQSTINPDNIFGAIRPLKMEEIFKTKTSRFRARTSSANWTGSDRLTAQEELEYARRMGFK